MQPAFYDDAFRSYFPGARQSAPPNGVGGAQTPVVQQAVPVARPVVYRPPDGSGAPADSTAAHMQDFFANFHQKLFSDLNSWKRAATSALAEVAASSSPGAAQPPYPPYQPYPVYAPYQPYPPLYTSPWHPSMAATHHPAMAAAPLTYSPNASEKPADASPSKALSCTVPTLILWIVLIVFGAIVLILILVYLAKLNASVNGVAAVVFAKTRDVK